MSTIETKEKIEAAAKKLFAEKGFDSVTTREIAKFAGVSHSALTYHFKSKDSLLLFLSEQFVNAQEKSVYSALPEVSSIHEFTVRMEVFLDAFIISLFQDLALFQLFHNEMERRNPVLLNAVHNPSVRLVPKLIRYFKLAQKNGHLSADVDVQMAALIFLNETIRAVKMDDVEHDFLPPGSLRKEANRKRWIQNLLRIVIGGIQTESSNGSRQEGRKK